MKNSPIKKYLDNLIFIENKIIEMKGLSLDIDLNPVKLINILIELNDKLIDYNLKYLNILEVTIFEFIKRYNDSILHEEYKKNIDCLYKTLECIRDEFVKLYNINIFFYGNDKFGLIKNKLLLYNVVQVRNEKELKFLSSKKKCSQNTKVYNILLVEHDITLKNSFFDAMLNYSKVAELLLNISEEIYIQNYDFNYLSNSLIRSYENDVESIIVGNSYSLVGIDEHLLNKNTINLSMHSQDLYYSYQLARKAITENKNIRRCIFGMSYYILCHDLSRGDSLYSKNMIENVYYPLLNDIHNSDIKEIKEQKNLNDCELDNLIKSIFNLKKVESYLKKQIYNRNTKYYNDINNVNRDKMFEDFDEKYKENLGLYRANQHNKIFKYTETIFEYRNILKEFFDFLDKNSVELIVIIFPTSGYYFKNIKLEYIKYFDNLIDQVKKEYNIKVIDLRNHLFEFDDTDFIDADHLNKKGAIKATNYLNEFIKSI